MHAETLPAPLLVPEQTDLSPKQAGEAQRPQQVPSKALNTLPLAQPSPRSPSQPPHQVTPVSQETGAGTHPKDIPGEDRAGESPAFSVFEGGTVPLLQHPLPALGGEREAQVTGAGTMWALVASEEEKRCQVPELAHGPGPTAQTPGRGTQGREDYWLTAG